MQHAGIIHYTGDSLSRFLTAGANRTKLGNEVPVVNINLKTFQVVPNKEIGEEEEEPHDYSNSLENLVLFLPAVFKLAYISEAQKLNKPDLREYTTAQTQIIATLRPRVLRLCTY